MQGHPDLYTLIYLILWLFLRSGMSIPVYPDLQSLILQPLPTLLPYFVYRKILLLYYKGAVLLECKGVFNATYAFVVARASRLAGVLATTFRIYKDY